jgi:hypothetical protein
MIASLDFEQPFPFGAILVPPVRIAGGRLRFKLKGPLRVANGLPGRLVFDFARLANASDSLFLNSLVPGALWASALIGLRSTTRAHLAWSIWSATNWRSLLQAGAVKLAKC